MRIIIHFLMIIIIIFNSFLIHTLCFGVMGYIFVLVQATILNFGVLQCCGLGEEIKILKIQKMF